MRVSMLHLSSEKLLGEKNAVSECKKQTKKQKVIHNSVNKADVISVCEHFQPAN